MEIKNVTGEQLSIALQKLNEMYDNNVTWNRYEQVGPQRFNITLKVAESSKKGSRLGRQQYTRKDGTTYRKHLANACWHVYGNFFEILLSLNPEITIIPPKNPKQHSAYYPNLMFIAPYHKENFEATIRSISHEFLHYVLHKTVGIYASFAFDAIAYSIADKDQFIAYGVDI